jgi:pSer/pThr/pTyr-binding forkhead associated (FHA) protein
MAPPDELIQVPSWGKKAAAAPSAPVFEPNVEPAAAPEPSAEPEPPSGGFTTMPATPPAPGGERPTDPEGKTAFVLDLPTGESFDVVGTTLIGRNPQPRPGESVDGLIAIGAWEKSVSKTHAILVPHPDGITVRDRGSSNGSWVIRADGTETRCAPGEDVVVRAGDRIRLGALDISAR